ncbi:STE/STE20 protein kinase [Helicocarpus griseus UAMH5409]|uniref:non-specific serine/threonine protein kinase n=1 Tax=Helicocarpus griseus UAMH5409 TaxID=1447875 RepID=A0A2B7Y5C6_9EURO|nr:STE/STE20 protein kinase [Helicocarpus griseus UAMH5409]
MDDSAYAANAYKKEPDGIIERVSQLSYYISLNRRLQADRLGQVPLLYQRLLIRGLKCATVFLARLQGVIRLALPSAFRSFLYSAPTVELGSYGEDEDFRVYSEPEPRLKEGGDRQKQKKPELRKEFQQFIELIDYYSLSLLDNTVTEVALEMSQKPLHSIKLRQKVQNNGNTFIDYAGYLGDGRDYIYKTVDRPLYNSMDTEVIREELRALELRGDQPHVITGILLEFYGGGSLEDFLVEHCLGEQNWQRLVIQIGTALSQLHNSGRRHMDIKPSNIVLDMEGNAILTDIGDMVVTNSWLAPEMKQEGWPPDKPFRERVLNDIWAYGKLLHDMSTNMDINPLSTHLRKLADKLMREPESRISLAEAIFQLERIK